MLNEFTPKVAEKRAEIAEATAECQAVRARVEEELANAESHVSQLNDELVDLQDEEAYMNGSLSYWECKANGTKGSPPSSYRHSWQRGWDGAKEDDANGEPSLLEEVAGA